MKTIVIVIEGGVLQDVIGLPTNIEYVLVDHDIHEGEVGYKTEDEIKSLVAEATIAVQSVYER